MNDLLIIMPWPSLLFLVGSLFFAQTWYLRGAILFLGLLNPLLYFWGTISDNTRLIAISLVIAQGISVVFLFLMGTLAFFRYAACTRRKTTRR